MPEYGLEMGEKTMDMVFEIILNRKNHEKMPPHY